MDERNLNRPYMNRHMTELPRWCLAQNLDAIEYCHEAGDFLFLALVEDKRAIGGSRCGLTGEQYHFNRRVAAMLDIPSFLVHYETPEDNEDGVWRYFVRSLNDAAKAKLPSIRRFEEAEYWQFHKDVIRNGK